MSLSERTVAGPAGPAADPGKRERHERQDSLVQAARELPQGRPGRAQEGHLAVQERGTSTTIVVIAATIFFGFYLFFMDIIFSWVIRQFKGLFG
jgi:preprotein translocase SecE subunit